MSKHKFKVGDRVIVNGSQLIREFNTIKGVIVHLSTGHPKYGVEFDDWKDGHECSGHCKKIGSGFYVNYSMLAHEKPDWKKIIDGGL